MIDKDTKSHRPYPILDSKWTSLQSWKNLLFAHWEVDPSDIRRHLPEALDLDLYDGKAYVGVVPFEMANVRPRHLPALPVLSTFPELNVRVYVKHKGRRGVYFISLDADRLIFVLGGRLLYKLPYYYSKMSIENKNNEYRYKSSRRIFHNEKALFQANYKANSEMFYSEKNSLEEFLTEQYRLFTVKNNEVYCCEIDHEKWRLQRCQATIISNDLLSVLKINPIGEAMYLYSENIDVKIWNLEKVEGSVS